MTTHAQMDALVDAHYRAYENDRGLLGELRIERFETTRRQYGEEHAVQQQLSAP